LSYGHTFANALGILKKTDLELQNFLIASAKLPLKFSHPASIDQIVNLLKRDEISTNERINLVVLKKIGKHEIVNDVDEAVIRSTLNKFLFFPVVNFINIYLENCPLLGIS